MRPFHPDGRRMLILILLLALVFPGLSIATTPTISSVSGTVSNGSTLTITGTDMVDQSTSNFDPFFTSNSSAYNFGGANPNADGYCADSGECMGNYDAATRLFGSNNTIHWNVNANGVAGNTSCPAQNLFAYNGLNRHSNGVADDLWVRFYSRWHAANNDWTFAYMKMYYAQSPGLNNEPGVYYESYNPGSTTGPTQMLVKVGGLDVTPSVPNPPDTTGRINNDEWHLYELEQNSLVSPPVVSTWMDGVQLASNYSGDAGAGVTLSNWYLLIGMVNTCGYDANFNVDEWFAGFAFGSARLYPASFVEISNNATYGAGTKIYQLPINISDTSQSVTVNLSGLGPGPYYLYVTNNLQQTSTAFSLAPMSPGAAGYGSFTLFGVGH